MQPLKCVPISSVCPTHMAYTCRTQEFAAGYGVQFLMMDKVFACLHIEPFIVMLHALRSA